MFPSKTCGTSTVFESSGLFEPQKLTKIVAGKNAARKECDPNNGFVPISMTKFTFYT